MAASACSSAVSSPTNPSQELQIAIGRLHCQLDGQIGKIYESIPWDQGRNGEKATAIFMRCSKDFETAARLMKDLYNDSLTHQHLQKGWELLESRYKTVHKQLSEGTHISSLKKGVKGLSAFLFATVLEIHAFELRKRPNEALEEWDDTIVPFLPGYRDAADDGRLSPEVEEEGMDDPSPECGGGAAASSAGQPKRGAPWVAVEMTEEEQMRRIMDGTFGSEAGSEASNKRSRKGESGSKREAEDE